MLIWDSLSAYCRRYILYGTTHLVLAPDTNTYPSSLFLFIIIIIIIFFSVDLFQAGSSVLALLDRTLS